MKNKDKNVFMNGILLKRPYLCDILRGKEVVVYEEHGFLHK